MGINKSMRSLLISTLARLIKRIIPRKVFRLVRCQLAVQSYFFCIWLLINSRILMNLLSGLSLLLLSQMKHLFGKEDFQSQKFRKAVEAEESFRCRCDRILFAEQLSATTMGGFFLMWCPASFPSGWKDIFFRCHQKFQNPGKWKTGSFLALHRLIMDRKLSFRPSTLLSFRCLILLAIYHICTVLPMIIGYLIYLCFDFNLRLLSLEQLLYPIPQKAYNKEAEKEKLSKVICQRKLDINRGIQMDFLRFFLVWSPTTVVSPELLASFLGKYDPNVDVRDRWDVTPGVSSTTAVFRGFVAKFYSMAGASQAVNALAVQREWDIRTMNAVRLLRFIADAECRHPLCGRTSSLLIVRARQGFPPEERERAKDMFSGFGEVKSIEYTRRIHPLGRSPVCSVRYAYATHAYAAQMYLDGSYLRFVRHVSLEVKETNYEKQIMRMTKQKVMEHLERNTFPRYSKISRD